VTTLDSQHRVDVLHVADSGPQRVQQFALLAEEVIPLQRQLVYQGGASGKRLVMTIRTDHLRPADVSVGLRAPSGREVELDLSQGEVTEEGVYRFASRQDSDLGSLLEENINGTWTATFSDNIQGVSGNLLGWEVRIDNSVAELPAEAEPEMNVIPEPGVARQMHSMLSTGGRRALTWPSDPLVRGDLLVWDISNGEILARIPRPANFTSARFALGHDAVFITAGSTIEFHSIATAQLLTRMTIEPTFTPVLSGNGRFLVVDTVLSEGDNALSVWDLDAVAEIGRFVTGNVAELVAADPQGRFMAVSDGDRLVRLWSVRDGKLIGEYEHAAKPVDIKFDAAGRWLMTQDAAFGFRAWSVGGSRPVITRRASSAWNASVSGDSLLLGSLDRGFELIDLVSGHIQGGVFGHGIPKARKNAGRYKPGALLASDHGFAVTYDGQFALKFWRLPPQLVAASSEEASSAARHVCRRSVVPRRLVPMGGTLRWRLLTVTCGFFRSTSRRLFCRVAGRARVLSAIWIRSHSLLSIRPGISSRAVLWTAVSGFGKPLPARRTVSFPDMPTAPCMIWYFRRMTGLYFRRVVGRSLLSMRSTVTCLLRRKFRVSGRGWR